MCSIVFVSTTNFNVRISPTLCEQYLRIDSYFFLFNLGMNGITEARIVWLCPPYKNVRFVYSILFPMKQQKITLNSYHLFPAVYLIQNMVNVLFIAHILRLPPSRLARKNM